VVVLCESSAFGNVKLSTIIASSLREARKVELVVEKSVFFKIHQIPIKTIYKSVRNQIDELATEFMYNSAVHNFHVTIGF
jgi:hypothetical protein